ncbi:MAG: pantetheine-phosphate adenylyltransferase [Bacteroidetes bacterium]|nr:MAG: pantetheine-phosphate adenylyltransferase [Bacteroidota bacterium]
MKRVAIFPGSFDPFTKGHENVIEKSRHLFDEIIIAIGVNSRKQAFFTLDSRLAHLNSLYTQEDQIRIVHYSELTTKLAKREGAQFLLRGLRDVKDFEYERSIAQMNHSLHPEIETVFIITKQEVNHINSSIVREIHKNGGVIDSFVTNQDLLVPSI